MELGLDLAGGLFLADFGTLVGNDMGLEAIISFPAKVLSSRLWHLTSRQVVPAEPV